MPLICCTKLLFNVWKFGHQSFGDNRRNDYMCNHLPFFIKLFHDAGRSVSKLAFQ